MSDNRVWRIGNVPIMRVIEPGGGPVPCSYFLGRSGADLDPLREWADPFIDGDAMVIAMQTFAIEVDGLKVLVDTCVGDDKSFANPEFAALGGKQGKLLDRLTEVGFGRDDVDVVICTHLHFDHVGWNTEIRDGVHVPTFNKARYVFSRREVEHWQANNGPYNVFDVSVQPLLDAGVVDLVPDDYRLTESLRYISTPGHSPGHVSVRIESGGQAAQITGDMVHTALQIGRPEWSSVADGDPDMAAITRRRMVEESHAEQYLVLGTHFGGPTGGHVARDADGFRFVPA